MKILIKNCTIIDSKSEYHLKKFDILIDNGSIIKIDKKIDVTADKIIESSNLHASVGWYDAKLNFNDPGFEVKEDIISGLKAAELGGFTSVSTLPNTQPTITNKTQIEYIINKSNFSPTEIFPFGALTENLKGENIAEYYDMIQSGAIAFTDGHHFVNAGIMYRALLYIKNFNGKIISFPYDSTIFGKGQMNESKNSILTGLKSIPAISEFLMVERDLSLVEYTNGSIHFTGISCEKSVELIQQAKAKGLKVTADTHIHNLVFTDENVLGFDSNYKVLPPYRSEKDRLALINGLKNETIDFVCSDHSPEDVENKELEFDYAAFGIIGTQTLFSVLNGINEFSLEEKIKFISTKPREIFDIKTSEIKEKNTANITLFDPDLSWEFTNENNASKSNNSPFLNQKLKGKVIGILNKGMLSLQLD